jgi:hypothetical protein
MSYSSVVNHFVSNGIGLPRGVRVELLAIVSLECW